MTFTTLISIVVLLKGRATFGFYEEIMSYHFVKMMHVPCCAVRAS